MWGMIWCVDLDTLGILETSGFCKLSEHARRAAHCYSVRRIGADIGFASQGKYLIQEPNQQLREEIVKYEISYGGFLQFAH